MCYTKELSFQQEIENASLKCECLFLLCTHTMVCWTNILLFPVEVIHLKISEERSQVFINHSLLDETCSHLFVLKQH